MNYIKLRIKLWRIDKLAKEGKVIPAARLLGVSIGDKTNEEFGDAATVAYRQFCDEVINARWF